LLDLPGFQLYNLSGEWWDTAGQEMPRSFHGVFGTWGFFNSLFPSMPEIVLKDS